MCFRLRTCCGCTSVEIGAQIISIFSILIALLEFGYCIWGVLALPLEEIKTIVVYVVLAVLGLFELFCASLLAYGAFRKQPSHMWPWLVLAWLKALLLLSAAVVLATILALAAKKPDQNALPADQVALVVICTVHAVVLVYATCVVNSRRVEIASDSYSDYEPRLAHSDSTVQRVYVPITSYEYND